MDIQNTREYKAAEDLERALNDYGWNPERFAESTRFFHRTLQQNLVLKGLQKVQGSFIVHCSRI